MLFRTANDNVPQADFKKFSPVMVSNPILVIRFGKVCIVTQRDVSSTALYGFLSFRYFNFMNLQGFEGRYILPRGNMLSQTANDNVPQAGFKEPSPVVVSNPILVIRFATV